MLDVAEIFQRDIRQMAQSLLVHKADRLSKKYEEKNLPAYDAVFDALEDFRSRTLAAYNKGTLLGRSLWDIQDLLVIACQVLLPPLRGKPFWSLQVGRQANGSMNAGLI